MIDPNKKYRTRDNREVRIYAVDGYANGTAIHGAIKNVGGWSLCGWFADGKYTLGDSTSTDLVEVKPRHKRTVWVNAYPSGHVSMWEDKRTADKMRDSHGIACIKVELDFEEGEGL